MLTRLLLTMLVVFIAVLAASRLMPGVRVHKTSTAVVVGLVFGVLNLLVAWLVATVAFVALLPAALLTFGLIYLLLHFIVNTIILWMTDKLMADFQIRGFGALLGTSALISVSGWVVSRFL